MYEDRTTNCPDFGLKFWSSQIRYTMLMYELAITLRNQTDDVEGHPRLRHNFELLLSSNQARRNAEALCKSSVVRGVDFIHLLPPSIVAFTSQCIGVHDVDMVEVSCGL